MNIDTRTKVTKDVLPTKSIQSKINDPIVISFFNITSPVKTVEILSIKCLKGIFNNYMATKINKSDFLVSYSYVRLG